MDMYLHVRVLFSIICLESLACSVVSPALSNTPSSTKCIGYIWRGAFSFFCISFISGGGLSLARRAPVDISSVLLHSHVGSSSIPVVRSAISRRDEGLRRFQELLLFAPSMDF